MEKNKIDSLLIDIDGVIFQGGNPIVGAKESINWLKENSYAFLFVTNATRYSNDELVKKFSEIGVNITEEDILNSAYAAADYIVEQNKNAKCFLTGADYLDAVYQKKGLQVTRNEEKVDFVVIGLDKRLNYEILSIAMRLLLQGAELIAMHEDRFYPSEGKLAISVGPFVRALEYSSGKKAVIIGKPNKNFYNIALKKIGTKPSNSAMIGDSIEGDIIGARKSGLKAILVKTGNYREADLQKSKIKPNIVIESIKDLPQTMQKI